MPPKYFGTVHLGSIRGFVASVSVGSTAFGPLLFATGVERTGSYTTVLLGSTVLPVAVLVAALVVRPPGGRGHAPEQPAAANLPSR